MEQAVIILIVAVFLGMQSLLKKLKNTGQDAASNNRPDFSPPSAPPELTEADKRYREIQEEIRRRVAQRQQQPQRTTQPVPQQSYRASPKSTSPVARPAGGTYKRPLQPPPSLVNPVSPEISAALSEVSASTIEAAATEAAAYALPEVSAAAGAATVPPVVGSIRALLASPSTVRQAFVLREVLDRPLCLRPVAGGHENWL